MIRQHVVIFVLICATSTTITSFFCLTEGFFNPLFLFSSLLFSRTIVLSPTSLSPLSLFVHIILSPISLPLFAFFERSLSSPTSPSFVALPILIILSLLQFFSTSLRQTKLLSQPRFHLSQNFLRQILFSFQLLIDPNPLGKFTSLVNI